MTTNLMVYQWFNRSMASSPRPKIFKSLVPPPSCPLLRRTYQNLLL